MTSHFCTSHVSVLSTAIMTRLFKRTLSFFYQENAIPLPTLADEQDASLVEASQIASKFPEDPCLLDKRIGLCRGAIRRYFFDRESKACKLFIYGGEWIRATQSQITR